MNIPETLSGPEWGHGCPSCSYGIVVAPAIVSSLNLSEGRAVQAAEDMIVFCDCRAGFMYRQCLRRVYNGLSIWSQKQLREIVMAANVPTVHFEAKEPA